MTDFIANIISNPIFENVVFTCIIIFLGLFWLYMCVMIIGAIVMMVKHVYEFKPEEKKYPCPDPTTCDIPFCNCAVDEMEKGNVVLKTKGLKYERFL